MLDHNAASSERDHYYPSQVPSASAPPAQQHRGFGIPSAATQQHCTSLTPFLLLLPTTHLEKWGIYALEHSCCHGIMHEGSMKHSPNKDISASHGRPFHTRGSGEGDATEPKTSRGDPAAGEAERAQSCILPVPQSKPVMEPFKEPRRKILPAQHDAVPLMGAESSAPAQIHLEAKNRRTPPPSSVCHLRSECDGFREGRPIYRSWWGRCEGASQCVSVPQPLGSLGPLLMPTARFCPLPGVAPWDGQQRGPGPGHRAHSL